MKGEDLNYFVKNLKEYFSYSTGISAEVGIPYVKEDDQGVDMECSGIIGVSGKKKGFIYFTADKIFTKKFAKVVMGIDENGDDTIAKDIFGEIANTISGNAMEYFGGDFMISIPMIIFDSKDKRLKLKSPIYVIPLEWNGMKSNLVIALEEG